MSETETSSSEPVSPEEARKLIASGEVRVFDLRTAEEFAEERIAGAIRIDPDELEGEIGKDAAGREKVLLICGDGAESAEVAERLRESGNDVRCIDGGFDSWTSESLPTAPGQDAEYEGPELGQPGVSDSSGDPEDEDEEQDGEKPPDSTRDVTERPVDNERAEQAESA